MTPFSVIIGLGYSLLPAGTKPETMLTNYRRGLVLFTWWQCHRKCSSYLTLPNEPRAKRSDVPRDIVTHFHTLTSSNGNIFRLTSHLCGKFTGQRRPVTRSFGVFFDLRLNKRLSKQSWDTIVPIMTSLFSITSSDHRKGIWLCKEDAAHWWSCTISCQDIYKYSSDLGPVSI